MIITQSTHTFSVLTKSLIAMSTLCYIIINMNIALGFSFQIYFRKEKQYNCTDYLQTCDLIFSFHENSLTCVLSLPWGRLYMLNLEYYFKLNMIILWKVSRIHFFPKAFYKEIKNIFMWKIIIYLINYLAFLSTFWILMSIIQESW